MPFALPPRDKVKPERAQLVHDVLTSEIAGHAKATTTYLFYEDIDLWLGPWGVDGYPIGYGKFYNMEFTTSPTLMNDPLTSDWVAKTTILLQEAIRDYVVRRVREGTIGKIAEEELREAAFDSHPKAYTSAGLHRIVMLHPYLTLVIGFIPAREFIPFYGSAWATYQQVFKTLGIIVFGNMTTTMAMSTLPSWGLFLGPSHRTDENRIQDIQRASRLLGTLQSLVESGRADDIQMLDRMAFDIGHMQFPHQDFTLAVRSLVATIERRRQMVRDRLRKSLERAHPIIRDGMEKRVPGLKPPSGLATP